MPTVEEVLLSTSDRMQKSLDSLERDLGSVRTGRASATLVENLMVDYYGTTTPLNQLSSITIPEARTIMIQPWDKQALEDVEKAILISDLGLIPNNDGTVIRINIPALTEERRRDLVKLVGRKVEDAHVAVRNIRRDGLERLRKMERDRSLAQDAGRRAQEQLQKVTDANISKMDDLRESKETEVMEV